MKTVETPIPIPITLPDGLRYSIAEFTAEFHGEERRQISVAVSFRGRRASDWQCRRALRLAGIPETSEEDNHFPGITRTFFWVEGVPADLQCECKTDETIVVEPDGYTWSRSEAR